MKTQGSKDELHQRYLLDDVSEEERQAIEERFLQDDDFFDEMLAVEDELYFDYRQDRLSTGERAVFERKFLRSAEDREKSAFADVFLQATAELTDEKDAAKRKIPEFSNSQTWRQSIAAFFSFSNPALQFGFATVSILFFLGLIGFFIQNARRQDETANLENSRNEQQQGQIIAEKGQQQTQIGQEPGIEKSPTEQNENQVRESEIAKTEPRVNQSPQKTVPQPPKSPTQQPAQQRSIVALVLSPGMLTRSSGEGMSRVTLSPSAKNLQLSLLLKNADYKHYRVALKTLNEGTQIWASADLKSQGSGKNKSLAFSIPAKNLQTADYEISLNGITETGKTEEITSYYFSVVKSAVK